MVIFFFTEEYGEDTWTTENVKVVTYRDGTPIPYVATMTEAFDSSIGHWTYANGDPSTGEILYNIKAVQGIWDADSAGDPSQRKELAPEGWHVPGNSDWQSLNDYLLNNYPEPAKLLPLKRVGIRQMAYREHLELHLKIIMKVDLNIKPMGYGLIGTGFLDVGELFCDMVRIIGKWYCILFSF